VEFFNVFLMFLNTFWPKTSMCSRKLMYFICHDAVSYSGPGSSYCRCFMITLGRTALSEWSSRSRDLCLTIHNIHNKQNIPVSGGIRNCNPDKRAAADPRFRPYGHWDRQNVECIMGNNPATYFKISVFNFGLPGFVHISVLGKYSLDWNVLNFVL
jgi:hypothetical protein